MANQSGVTMIELLIGTLVGLIVMAGTIHVVVTMLSSSRDVLNSARLNQDLSAIMSIVSGDVRRAGHWVETASNATSPYTDIDMDLNVVNTSCILYNYDSDANGSLESTDYRGVKFEANAIHIKRSGTSMNDCSAGNWERLSDQNFMTIDTGVSGFIDNSSCLVNGVASAGCPATVGADEVAQVREILITISALVNSDNDWRKTVTETVKVRNDFYND